MSTIWCYVRSSRVTLPVSPDSVAASAVHASSPSDGCFFRFLSKYPNRLIVDIGISQPRSMYTSVKSGVAGSCLYLLAQGGFNHGWRLFLLCRFHYFCLRHDFITGVYLRWFLRCRLSHRDASLIRMRTECCCRCCCCSVCCYAAVAVVDVYNIAGAFCCCLSSCAGRPNLLLV